MQFLSTRVSQPEDILRGCGRTYRSEALAIAFTSFIFVVDEGDAVALVLPGPAVSYTTSWDTTAYSRIWVRE